ncbi:MAG: flagellin [Verrucomicrobiota bacterium]|nr:flagellin [Verrucomicrobiota bacterium]
MAISLNTNLAANQAMASLHANQNELDQALNRLASGSKVDQVTEDAEVQRLSAIIKRFKSAKANIANAMSFTQAQQGYLKGVADALERMGELAMIANDETKTTDDRAAYNEEYKQLFSFIEETVTKSFNGRELYNDEDLMVSAGAAATDAATLNGINLQHGYAAGTTWPPITTDDDGNELSVQAVNENLYSFYEVLRKERDADGNATGNPETDISTLAKARTILEKIENALLAVSRYRATVGAHQSSLEGHVHQIDVAIDNYDASRGRIEDVDVAEESTRLAKYNILVQSSTAILAQANQIPQNVLRLLN